ncbi:hypothetical protein ZEAMMB73_Zm00001d030828 [Zea mays]|uniref:Uncharacterized protein n=1 Tax=Zea mays TaxID=4577 RepID=A0A1D6KEL5_MAIZE|nr:hypothetical protein ZEAMMB73_Zm00001d030828 [Zea mays]
MAQEAVEAEAELLCTQLAEADGGVFLALGAELEKMCHRLR